MPASPARIVTVIPAAGHSRRMGQPKWLLPWGKTTILGELLRVLHEAGLSETYVITRQEDVLLQEAVRKEGATPLLPPCDPPDMRSSVEFGLQHLLTTPSTTPPDAWLLIPSDHPLVSRETLRLLLSQRQGGREEILVPTYQGKRGHPTLFDWSIAQEVTQLPPDTGLNRIVRAKSERVREIPVDDPGAIADLDTPEDYAYWRERMKQD